MLKIALGQLSLDELSSPLRLDQLPLFAVGIAGAADLRNQRTSAIGALKGTSVDDPHATRVVSLPYKRLSRRAGHSGLAVPPPLPRTESDSLLRVPRAPRAVVT